MKALHFWFTGFFCWFFLIYNIERLSEPVNIASFVYLLTAFLTVLILMFSWLEKVPTVWLLVAPLALLFALKIWLGYPIGGRALPITITEIVMLEITVLLARQVANGLTEFRQAVTSVMISHLKNRAQSFDIGQGEMYREVRLARIQQRPLTVFTIYASEQTTNLSIERFMEQLRSEMINKYIDARIAHFLSEEMRDYDIIAQCGDHFIALLPGIDREEAGQISKKLQHLAKEKLGLVLTIGTSNFPEEEVTFERLIERAELNTQPATVDRKVQPELAAPEPVTAAVPQTVDSLPSSRS